MQELRRPKCIKQTAMNVQEGRREMKDREDEKEA